MKNYYDVLGVSRDASEKDIKARFREFVRSRHPDQFSGDEKQRAEEEFQNFTEAFNVLTDARRRRELDQELDRPPDREADHQQKAKVLLARGVKAYKEGKFIDAAGTFHQATEADPGNPKTWYHLALACTHEKRWLEKGRGAVDRCLELRPDHPPYLKLAGKIYAASGMTARAKEYYNRAAEVGSHDPEIQKALRDLGGPLKSEPQPQKKGGLFGKLF